MMAKRRRIDACIMYGDDKGFGGKTHGLRVWLTRR
jgi:hypothetical protein